ncbi:MAG: M23 family metallopeptidase [Elusimicrobiales bacterium]|nr:M23 family metallopeptidase [Elusimicrobiales bacterium]
MQLSEISFSGNKFVDRKFIGGPSSSEFFRFANVINKIDYSRLSEKEITDTYRVIKSEAQQRIRDYEKLFNYLTSHISRINSTPKGWPVTGYITSSFGYRIHPFTFSYDFHSGVDIVNTPGIDVKVTADGVVRYTGWAMGYGLCVIVDHGFGYTTLYGHLSQVMVKVGDIIKRGTIIGKLGSTGTSTGPHLHYEVWEYGVPKNPIKYISIIE